MKLSMKYTWLLLDADGTLFDYDKAEAMALEKAFVKAGYAYQPAYREAYQRINDQLWQAFEHGELSADTIKVRRFQELFTAIGLRGDPVRFSSQYLACLAERADLLDGAEALVRALYGQINMLVITNGLAEVQRHRFARSGLQPYIADIVISDEVGASKPDPRIFDVAFTRMGNPAREAVLMVGDSLSSDMRGGRGYGIDVCWFNPAGRPRPEDLDIQYEIADLSELLLILE